MEIPTVVRDDDLYPDEGEALDLGGTPSASVDSGSGAEMWRRCPAPVSKLGEKSVGAAIGASLAV